MQNHPGRYNFADLLTMKPGTIIGGLVHSSEGAWGVGLEWLLLPRDINLKRSNIYSAFPITEYKVKWRQRLRDYSRLVGSSRVYTPSLEIVEQALGNSNNTVKIGFDPTKPVGIYLGHFLRCDGVSLINILSPEGFDIWLNA